MNERARAAVPGCRARAVRCMRAAYDTRAWSSTSPVVVVGPRARIRSSPPPPRARGRPAARAAADERDRIMSANAVDSRFATALGTPKASMGVAVALALLFYLPLAVESQPVPDSGGGFAFSVYYPEFVQHPPEQYIQVRQL
eukprot:SAG31_NODE_3029_length_4768_cov_4.130863_6_plen_142_part_00